MARRFGTRRDRRIYPKAVFSDVEQRISRIHGLGQFATRDIRSGEPVTDRGIPDFVGYNHSRSPNLTRRVDSRGNFIGVFALRDIRNGEELTLHYNLKQRVNDDGTLETIPNPDRYSGVMKIE